VKGERLARSQLRRKPKVVSHRVSPFFSFCQKNLSIVSLADGRLYDRMNAAISVRFLAAIAQRFVAERTPKKSERAGSIYCNFFLSPHRTEREGCA
jgi:hypothetical protein